MGKKKKKEKKSAKAAKDDKKPKQGKTGGPKKKPQAPLPDESTALLFGALSDENRIAIMNLLSQKELCASELLKSVPIVQSTMSHHMKVLAEAGLVSCRREGKRVYYSVNEEGIRRIQDCAGSWKSR